MPTARRMGFLPRSLRFNRLLRRWTADDRGSTALEFSSVAIPFLMFILGFIGCAIYFFVSNSLEKGMDQTSRLIRTGEAVSKKMTVNQFKQSICDGAGSWIDCNKLQIDTVHCDSWSALSDGGSGTCTPYKPKPCIDSSGVPLTNSAPGTDLIAIYSGTASDVVIVTACYQWDFTSKLPIIKLGNMSNGSMMLQSATAFRSEPYPES
ncbi:MAG: pilus assembly protein [Hyphomicrobium denitrificans]|nr:pilus assembly protein [Hyphomicrobium denitrificans]